MLSFWKEKENSEAKRTIFYRKNFEKNPFLYHKKKNIFLVDNNNGNDSNKKNINQELLFIQKDNERNVNLFHKFLKSKSQSIEHNISNYMNYMVNKGYKGHKKPNIHLSNNNVIVNNILNFSDCSIDQSFDFKKNNNQTNNINITNQKVNYFPCLSPRYGKKKGSDVTNPCYFDDIAMKLIKNKNKDILAYNYKAYKQKYNPKYKIRKIFSFDKQLSLPPGRINNPRYYMLGESKLKSNPIVSPGNRFISPCFNYNFNKRKSELSLQ